MKNEYQTPSMDIVVLFGDVRTDAGDHDVPFGDVIGTSNMTGTNNPDGDWTIYG